MEKAANRTSSRRCVRDGFDANGNVTCEHCFEKKLEIDRLRAENQQLKAQLRTFKRREVVPIGAHSPPSHRVFKVKSSESNRSKKGGASVGHKGSGRRKVELSIADSVEKIPAPTICPDCQSKLQLHGVRERSIYDVEEITVRKKLYAIERRRCLNCKRLEESKLPVFPRALYSNALLSRIATQHYLHGIPLGRICEMLGPEIKLSGVLAALQRLGKLWEPALALLIEEYRSAPVKHADETSWRTDGASGWAWVFCSSDVSIFECQNSRSARVATRILGEQPLPGTLVVDRFPGYNKMPCQIQYCYAHLQREVKKLGEEFPDNAEVTAFCITLTDLLGAAMVLPSLALPDEAHYQQARSIVRQIQSLTTRPSEHLGVQSVQRIFSSRQDRLFLWALNRDVPAHNNRAEQELRRTVIARKVSFGSQSLLGAKTRSTLMSILVTARKRLKDISVETWFTSALNKIALEQLSPILLIPPVPT